MKNWVRLISLLICAVCLFGCDLPDDFPEEEGATTETTTENSDFEAQEIQVAYAGYGVFEKHALNGDKLSNREDRHFPIFRLDCAEDLATFKNDAQEAFLCIDEGLGEVPSFNSVSAKYDAAFFENNSLIVVYQSAESTFYQYGRERVCIEGNTLCVYVGAEVTAGPVSKDRSGWFIVIPLSKSQLAGCTVFDATFERGE